jgi:hypothetical protein
LCSPVGAQTPGSIVPMDTDDYSLDGHTNQSHSPVKTEYKQAAPSSAVKLQSGKKRKVEAISTSEGTAATSSTSGTSKQLSMVVIRLEEIAKALGTLNGHIGVIARAVSGDKSRGKAAAAVSASYARAKSENSRVSNNADSSGDEKDEEEDDDDDVSDGDGKRGSSARKGGAVASSLAAEVQQNAKFNAKGKENSAPAGGKGAAADKGGKEKEDKRDKSAKSKKSSP